MNYDISDVFPFETPRPEQLKAIEFILDAYLVRKKKYCIVDLGTGIGKSAVAVAVSRYLRKVDPESNSYFLTTQKLLQDQYVKDFGSKQFVTVSASTNYCCEFFDEADYKASCAEIGRLISANSFFRSTYSHCAGNCRYKLARAAFMEAPEGVTNYSYFLASTTYSSKKFEERKLLVLDEAHTVEDQLSKFIELTISMRFAKEHLDLDFKKSSLTEESSIEEVIRWIRLKYKTALQLKVNEMKTFLDNMKRVDSKIKTFEDYAKTYEKYDKHMCKINRFLEQYASSRKDWIMNLAFVDNKGERYHKWEFKPIYVRQFFEPNLSCFAKHVLLMSATILDVEVFCESLGIKMDDVAYLKIPSTFPIENRQIHIMPVGSMSLKHIDTTLPAMAKAVEVIINTHATEKGIVHCNSFKIAKFLHENLKNDRLLIHGSDDRAAVLAQHENSDQPTVLLSPSMTEGVDLADDKSRFQIVCKIPYPYLGDKVVQRRMENNDKWYANKTIKTLVQSLGRSIRNSTDSATSYILDSDWKMFYTRNKKLIPQEIIDAIKH
jgi:ATP-dependent DNA helicase DinG